MHAETATFPPQSTTDPPPVFRTLFPRETSNSGTMLKNRAAVRKTKKRAKRQRISAKRPRIRLWGCIWTAATHCMHTWTQAFYLSSMQYRRTSSIASYETHPPFKYRCKPQAQLLHAYEGPHHPSRRKEQSVPSCPSASFPGRHRRCCSCAWAAFRHGPLMLVHVACTAGGLPDFVPHGASLFLFCAERYATF